LVNDLIFGGQWRFLPPAGRLGRIESTDPAGAFGAHPLTLQVRIFRIIPGLGICNRRAEPRQRDCTDHASVRHGHPPEIPAETVARYTPILRISSISRPIRRNDKQRPPETEAPEPKRMRLFEI